jgi:hypothetical protein
MHPEDVKGSGAVADRIDVGVNLDKLRCGRIELKALQTTAWYAWGGACTVLPCYYKIDRKA